MLPDVKHACFMLIGYILSFLVGFCKRRKALKTEKLWKLAEA
jgi:hypothetical protein